LVDGVLAVGRAQLAAEVLLGDDVGRVLRPALGELDTALLEGGATLSVGIADDRVAGFPLELVVGVDPLGGEAALDGEALFGRPCLRSGPGHQIFSSRLLSGGGRAASSAFRTELASPDRPSLRGFPEESGRVPANCR